MITHSASALESEGVTLTDVDVERDGFIITGSGPGASREFGETIAAAVDEWQVRPGVPVHPGHHPGDQGEHQCNDQESNPWMPSRVGRTISDM